MRGAPTDKELLQRSMFSSDLMQDVVNDLNCLNNQAHFTRTFKVLYDQSLSFNTYQSHFNYYQLIQYVYETKQGQEQIPDFNKFLNEFNSYTDLRTCECIDYVMSVYTNLDGYHRSLCGIYEKMVDGKRDQLLLKHFESIIYYHLEKCQLLLRCNCVHRLSAEIEKAKQFIEDFKDCLQNKDDIFYNYKFMLIKYKYDLFEAMVLQRTRGMQKSREICEQNLKALNTLNEKKPWEILTVSTESSDNSSAAEKRNQFKQSKFQPSKGSWADLTLVNQSYTSTVNN